MHSLSCSGGQKNVYPNLRRIAGRCHDAVSYYLSKKHDSPSALARYSDLLLRNLAGSDCCPYEKPNPIYGFNFIICAYLGISAPPVLSLAISAPPVLSLAISAPPVLILALIAIPDSWDSFLACCHH